jgi:hypothetical protein
MPGLSGSSLDMFPPSLASLNATSYVIHPSAWKANPVPYNMGGEQHGRMEVSYNLTEGQKDLLRKLVQEVKAGNLPEEYWV